MSTSTKDNYINNQLIEDVKKDNISLGHDHIEKAKLGDGRALYLIGLEYYYKESYEKAMKWCRLSRVRGEPLASNVIGLMYQKGHGIPVDDSLAMQYYLESAEQGLKSSFCNIAEMFETAKGVPMNKQKALEWYNKDKLFGAKHVKRLNAQGYQIEESEKAKSIYSLIAETNKIVGLKENNIVQAKTGIFRQETTNTKNPANMIKPLMQYAPKSYISGRKTTIGNIGPTEQLNQNRSRLTANERQMCERRFKFINQRINKLKALEQKNKDLNRNIEELENTIKRCGIVKSHEPGNANKLDEHKSKNNMFVNSY